MREARTNKAKQNKCIMRDVGLINIDYNMAFSISTMVSSRHSHNS